MTTAKQKAPALSKRLRAALAIDGPHFGRPRPKPRELIAIKNALKSRSKNQPEISLGKLMRVAVDADPSSDTAKLVSNVLADSKLDNGVRRQAATLLGDLPFIPARNALHKQLSSREAHFEPTLLKALAKIGDSKTIMAIKKLPKTNSDVLRKMRNSVATVIAYRIGEKPTRTREHALIPRSTPLLIESEKPAKVKTVVDKLRGSNYGLKLKRDFGLCFNCGDTKHVLLVNDDLKRGQFAENLLAKRRIVGVIAMEEEDSNDFVTRYLVFVKPTRQQAVISVINTSGEVVMMGKFRRTSSGLELEMRDHTNARVPTNVTGLITDSEVHIQGELFPESSREKNAGEVDTSMYKN